MYIQIINFNWDISEEGYDKAAIEGAPTFANIDGLIIKNMLYNHETKTQGGCYMWETKEAMEAYKRGEVFKSIFENPDFKNVTSKEFCVHAKATILISEIQKDLKNQRH